jgi:hypothetical protein
VSRRHILTFLPAVCNFKLAKILANVVPFVMEETKDMHFEYHGEVVLSEEAKQNEITLTGWSFKDKQYRILSIACIVT